MSLNSYTRSKFARDEILETIGGIPSGPTGERGPIGPQGSQGYQGETGLMGEIGPIGPQGFQGSDTGYTGAQGSTGQRGLQGFQGFQGNQGIIGQNGSPGGLNMYLDTNGGIATIGSPISGDLLTSEFNPVQSTITFLTNGSTNNVQIAYFNTSPLNSTFIPAANWIFNIYAGVKINTFNPSFYVSLYQVDSDGSSNPILISNGSANTKVINQLDTSNFLFTINQSVPAYYLTDSTKLIQLRIYVNNGFPVVREVVFKFRNNTISYVQTSFGAQIGMQGSTGSAGIDGITGSQGLQGFQGIVGAIGPIGATGPIGETGQIGPQGNQGAAGSGGFTGTNMISSGTYTPTVDTTGAMSIFSNNTNPSIQIDNGRTGVYGNYLSGYNTNSSVINYGTTGPYGFYKNTSIGSHVSPNIVGGLNNTLIGYGAGFNFGLSQTGSIYSNTVIGTEAACTSTNGNQNTIIGYAAAGGLGLTGNTGTYSYSQNTIIGSGAARNITTGNANVVYSYNAAANLTTGSNNIVCGVNAGLDLVNGIGNVFFGGSAGRGVISGNYNIYLGYLNRPNNDISSSIMLNATGAIIANATNGSFIVAPIRSTSNVIAPLVYNTSTFEIQYSTSSRKYKKNIVDITYDTSSIFNVRVVEFDNKEDGSHHVGTIAEELSEIDENFSWNGPDGAVDGANYNTMLCYLINESKKMYNKINRLENENKTLSSKNRDFETRIRCLETKFDKYFISSKTIA